MRGISEALKTLQVINGGPSANSFFFCFFFWGGVREVTHNNGHKACYTAKKHTQNTAVFHARLLVKAARLGLAAMRIICAVPRMNWHSFLELVYEQLFGCVMFQSKRMGRFNY